MSFRCVIVGQGPEFIACSELLLQHGHSIVGVISDCPQVSAWSQKKGISRIDSSEDVAPFLNDSPFDYLFSIVNETIKLKPLLDLPQLGTINYHDSLLPEYGGFNAVAWAILDGQANHGITWHWVNKEVHEGPTIVQKSLPILEDDTAFSLRVRSNELAVQAFAEVLSCLGDSGNRSGPIVPIQKHHFKSERPSFPVLNFLRPAQDFVRLVRALDFGAGENWMSRAKFRTPSGRVLCVGRANLSTGSKYQAGVVGSVSAIGFKVGTNDGNLLLGELCLPNGQPVDFSQYEVYGLTPGAKLPLSPADQTQALKVFDAEVTRYERYWLQKLKTQQTTELTELKVAAATGKMDCVKQPLPSGLALLAASEQQGKLSAALLTYLGRSNDGGTQVGFGFTVPELSSVQLEFYTSIVPMSLTLDPQSSWAGLVETAKLELSDINDNKTFSKDIWTRYPALQTKTISDHSSSVVLSLSDYEKAALPDGVLLLVALSSATNELALYFDTGAISKPRAQRLAARLCHLIEIGSIHPETPASQFPIVTPEEEKLLLSTFQDTHRPAVDFSCIHTLFEQQVARTPDKTALVFRDSSYSYRELNERANALAFDLQTAGVGPDELVAISVERSLHMVVGLLAILKAGGAYIPLDPAYPAERLAMMLEDSGAKWLVTQPHLASHLPHHSAKAMLMDETAGAPRSANAPSTAVQPHHLAYVMFTSGSTGRPKGVMIEHKNVANFFAGMDETVGPKPGIWLAVTSISFDISVLEIFWTLTRGFEVVIQEESDKASLLKTQGAVRATSRPMDFGLFYFAADSTNAATHDAYRLLLDGARFADTHDFKTVWTPERHFHAFGGLYPNPAVTSAAIAAITQRVDIRAGSVVIALHDPIRVAEDWAVVDNLSRGRVGLSFASGWHANDFAIKPENYEHRHKVMYDYIDTVLRLWAGEKIKVKNGLGETIEVGVLPRPVRERPPMWIAAAGNVETYRTAGRAGYNILTNMLGQDISELAKNVAAYREARVERGHAGPGTVSVMLHTFVTNDDAKARELARGPFGNYLQTSYDLVKVAPWMFPSFKRPSEENRDPAAFDPSHFDSNDMQALLDHAFDRYFDTAGLFGSPERAIKLIEELKDAGANEVACLVDFGIDTQVVLDNLPYLDELRKLSNPESSVLEPINPISVREQFERRQITHLQCTPSMARLLVADGSLKAMGSLQKFLLGGEALPVDLATTLQTSLAQTQLINMYGPTETTVWSTSAALGRLGDPITIGKPIANTQVRILDPGLQLSPIGTAGELCIGGAGVVRGYLHRPDLTGERFIADPYSKGNRLYRTGDLARYREDGAIEYIGRMDQQVKVNGYRIELGEIETVLGKHPAVKESVVAVKETTAGPVLVGYVIGASGVEAGSGDSAKLNDWKQRWDEAYSKRTGAQHAEARFNTSGWLNSFTGEPISPEHMQEWLDNTVRRIRSLSPKKVLEIGCGTGMILYALLPHVEHYTALDLSPFALETIRKELSPDERSKVTLFNKAAHELEAVADQSCDLVVINSVAQYFPNVDYLLQVLEQASRVLRDEGNIFLGDVRSLEEVDAFHALVELQKAPGQATASQLPKRVSERVAMDTELLLSSSFFAKINQRVPRLSLASIQLKQGLHSNEMRDFRSDVVLHVGTPLPGLTNLSVMHFEDASIQSIKAALASKPAVLCIKGLTNARTANVYKANDHAAKATSELTVETLRDVLNDAPAGVDPQMLYDLVPGYRVELRFGSKPGTFDALFQMDVGSFESTWLPDTTAATPGFSTPRGRIDSDNLVSKLKSHLKEYLPDYMVPQAFVLMEAFPLTPNGKIDRKSLPAPTEVLRQSAKEFVSPGNDLERTIAGIWQELLRMERVGRKDNIFDIGASSLLTVEANNKLQTALARKVPLVTMFRYPTIESLAAYLTKTFGLEGQSPSTNSNEQNAEEERQNRLNAAAQRRRQARAQI